MPVQHVIVVRPVRHGTHAVLTILTAGLWGVVWIIAVLQHRDKLRRIA